MTSITLFLFRGIPSVNIGFLMKLDLLFKRIIQFYGQVERDHTNKSKILTGIQDSQSLCNFFKNQIPLLSAQLKYRFYYCFACNRKDVVQFNHTVLSSALTLRYAYTTHSGVSCYSGYDNIT
jgi:hypothetical protein